ncbi:MAG TPA: glycoside hydrolase family 3 protein [Gaiellaceae bacterium]|nr:glycoside hydrolase family 3 protein [Gaiellaceae bacterium]
MAERVERLAWGCLLASFPGPEPPPSLEGWIERGLGGVVLFAGNVRDPEQLRGLTNGLRARRPGLLVAVDEEGGDVTRLEAAAGSSYPGALALGSVDDPALTEAVAGSIAAELAAAGVNLNLAPVADVNTNPENPVIGVRSFGSDPELVARHVRAFVTGTQACGVAACAKHFPGHGDTTVDSHLALARVERSREELAGVELLPFAAAVGAGVAAVMTGHLVVPAIDAEPATLSAPLVSGLLRQELGFRGLVITDALDMRAIADTVGVAEGAVRALAVGVDAICLGPSVGREDVEAAQRTLVDAVAGGRLQEERLGEAAARVEATARAANMAGGVPDRALGAGAARRAIRVRGDADVGESPVVVELRPEPLVAAGETGASLGRALRARLPRTLVVAVRDEHDLPRLDGSGLVVVVRDAARHPWQQRAAGRLLALHRGAVVVETGVPGWTPPAAAALVETHGAGRASLEAAADVLAAAAVR